MHEIDWQVCDSLELMLAVLRGKVTSRKIRLFASSCCRRLMHLLIDESSRAVVEKSDLFADNMISTDAMGLAWDAAKNAQCALSADFEVKRNSLKAEIWRILGKCPTDQMIKQEVANGNSESTALMWGLNLAVAKPEERAKWVRDAGGKIERLHGGQQAFLQMDRLLVALESEKDKELIDAVEEYRRAGSWSWAAAAACRLAWVAQTEEDVFCLAKSVSKFAATAASLFSSIATENGERKIQCSLLREIVANPFAPLAIDKSWMEWNEGAVLKAARAIYDAQAFDEIGRVGVLLQESGCNCESMLRHCQTHEPHMRGCWLLDVILGNQ